MSPKHHSRPQNNASPTHPWASLLPYGIALSIGAGTVGILSILFPRFVRCAPLNDVPSWMWQAVFLAISQLIIPSALSQIIPKKYKIKNVSQKTQVAITIVAGFVAFLFFRVGLPAPAETVCYPDLKIIYGLIDAEKEAVLNKDMSKIETIYSPDAVIENIALGKTWGNPTLYYGPKFKDEVHCSLKHTQYTRVQLTSTEAIITTASSGTWGRIANANGCSEVYNNPAGSDYWIFTKTDSQWRVTELRFNCYAAAGKC